MHIYNQNMTSLFKLFQSSEDVTIHNKYYSPPMEVDESECYSVAESCTLPLLESLEPSPSEIDVISTDTPSLRYVHECKPCRISPHSRLFILKNCHENLKRTCTLLYVSNVYVFYLDMLVLIVMKYVEV